MRAYDTEAAAQPALFREQEAAVDAPPMTVMLAVKQACQTDDVPRTRFPAAATGARCGLACPTADRPVPSAPNTFSALRSRPSCSAGHFARIHRLHRIHRSIGAVRSFDRSGCAGNDEVSLLVSSISERRAGGRSVRTFADTPLPATMHASRPRGGERVVELSAFIAFQVLHAVARDL